ncbi:hypothetical protein AKJ09_08570 [Labilithrix luteola]|uniref:RNA polymerase sigma factor 70 region 4 type 2 domain-containing protein n=1 Tax=Labilithrix luteola TaxID=1391654 RepID=A0A0K1Q8C3_9BACT|nr:sigma-70 region 4 domain-containing protein [Labilithrix luteola]AKV01907.1 hypothetical protein AKJ09_08570 [Labilithrix luteola]
MATYAGGVALNGEADSPSEATLQRGAPAIRAHACTLARVAMAWLGSETEVSRVLEQVARELGAATWSASDDDLVVAMRFLRAACATKLSSAPMLSHAPARRADGGPALARAALEALRPTERDAVVLRLVGGLRTDQIASVCSIDEGAARDRLTRGLARLLEKEEGR